MTEYIVKDRNGRIVHLSESAADARSYASALNRDYQTGDYRVFVYEPKGELTP